MTEDYVGRALAGTATIIPMPPPRGRPPPGDEDNPLSEDAIALRFSARHEPDRRYVATKAQWLTWDGRRWRLEATLLAFDLARDSCRADVREYGNGKPPPGILTGKTIAAIERLARLTAGRPQRSISSTPTTCFSPRVIDMGDVTFDLSTGVGRPPNPADYITKKTACSAAPAGTPHPVWTGFLDRITDGDAELEAFLQRYMGYCCTGHTSEHKFVFAYGTGANGKGTFINTCAAILGDYATVADVGTFIASNTERHPTDLAKLHGYRLVVAQETEKGRRWDEAKIKTMTGGDRMTARFMRQDFFDFVPKFKLFIVGNHKPRLDNVDEAMRRRLLLVPFTVQIPAEERDPDLPAKLKAEWPAILRWMLDGCLEWQKTGLAAPKMVTDATDEYFNDQDVMKQWLEDCTADGGPFAFTPTNQLFASWKCWCDERNLKPGGANALSDALVDRGFVRKRAQGGVRGFSNLTVATS
jgi:putative DNA primase/helicase